MDPIYPSDAFSRGLRAHFGKRIQSSLSYLLEYWGYGLDLPLCKSALTAVENVRVSDPFFWCICAINRRLVDLSLRDSKAEVEIYFHELVSLNSSTPLNSFITPINVMNRMQKALFTHYATERSWTEKPELATVLPEEVESTEELIQSALGILGECLPNFLQEFNNCISTFLLYTSSEMSSGTTFSLGNAIYLQSFREVNQRNVFVMLDRIIHETAHMLLHFQSAEDPFVLNPASESYPSPFRDDKRPIIGIFHAHFVLFRLITAFTSPRLKEKLNQDLVETTVARYVNAFERTGAVLAESADFTPLGREIFEGTVSSYPLRQDSRAGTVRSA